MSTTAPAIAGQDLQADPNHRLDVHEEQQRNGASTRDRSYHSFEGEAYSLPNDHSEHERLNIQDKAWKLTLHGGLHIAPISETITRAVDIGAGAGEWAMDFARAHPRCQVLGVDLSDVDTSGKDIPGNVKFAMANANEDWEFGGQMDFIHSRLLVLGIRDWSAYFRRAYDNLKPGGWVEVQEVRFPGSYIGDGGSTPETPIYKFSQGVRDATLKLGIDAQASDHFQGMLKDAGFENIRYERFGWAVGAWPKDKRDKEIGALTAVNIGQYFVPGLANGLFVKVLGWSQEQADEMVEQVKKDIDDPETHFYFVFTLCCAQKPAS